VLALAFLVMVGMALTAEAFDVHVPKGYIYAAMAFSLAVEALNIRSARQAPGRAAGQWPDLCEGHLVLSDIRLFTNCRHLH
jgi:predicted tellurium resistance membrane protein TerC